MFRALIGIREQRTAARADARRRRGARLLGLSRTAVPLGLLLLAGVLWLTALAQMNPDRMGALGLVSIMPISFVAALGVLTISFALLLRRSSMTNALPLVHAAALVVMIHGTPTILYGTLRYSWAWKHLGIIDYIQRHGAVEPTIEFLTPYHNWPGFFGFFAFVAEAAGVTNLAELARWAPVYFNLLNLGALVLIFRSLTADRRLIWLGVWFFFLMNWVAQDYFSPQAEAYFLYLVAIGVCLRWFRSNASPPNATPGRFSGLRWLATPYWAVVKRANLTMPLMAPACPAVRVGLLAVALLSLFTLVYSHQITPIFAVLSLTALVVFRSLSARTLPIFVTLGILAWMAYPAFPFVSDNLLRVISRFGQVQGNVGASLIDSSRTSDAQAFISLVSRGFVAAVGFLAFLGLVRRLRHGMWDLIPILLIVAPASMLAVDTYGGELLFRVFLFSVPFLAFLAAGLVFPAPASGRSPFMPALAFALSALLLVGFSVSYYGKDKQYYFTPQEVAASEFLYDVAPEGALLVEGSRNYPGQLKNYERFTYVAIGREPEESKLKVLRDPEGQLARWMANPKYSASYLIITRSQVLETEALGDLPPGSLASIEKALRASPRFQVVFSNKDATIFVLRGRPS